jgi:UPF0755 protein
MQDFDLRPISTGRTRSRWKYAPLYVASLIFILYFIIRVQPPETFPVGTIIHVSQGETVLEIVDYAKKNHLVRSASFLKFFVGIFQGNRGVIAGDYYFDEPLTAPRVAKRLVSGTFGLRATKITIPEGSTRVQIADIVGKELLFFKKDEFLKMTKLKEGYLFPDTYLVSPTATTTEIIALLEKNFSEQIGTLQRDITQSGRSERDIVIMASILEAEARQSDTRKMVAGILWRRIALGMPLQVDASLRYITGKSSAELTLDDLAMKSPYNTYLHAGLTPTPISNPGLDAILAAITSNQELIFVFSH